MKVEYSYYGSNPSLVIKGTDFIKACKDVDERYLLQIAIEGFAQNFNVPSHFCDEVNDTLLNSVDKNGDVIYALRNYRVGKNVIREWCEVYVRNGSRLIDIVISDDNGLNYALNNQVSLNQKRNKP